MITIFNQKELIITDDLKTQADVRTILADHKIPYKTKTVNRMSPSPLRTGSRAHAGSFGINMDRMYEYTIYVKKADYDKAFYLLRKNFLR